MSNRLDEAVAVALKYLGKRDRFEAEVHAHLISKGFEEIADAACERLRRRRILDDDRVAELVVRSSCGRKSVSKDLIREKLEARGATAETICRAVAELHDAQSAATLAQMKRDSGSSALQTARFLSSRGFEEGEIESVVSTVFGEAD